ncbi:prepilin-type N-terminal cleavage/methylation domain-containing protein [Patescibacteria group bacterium]|nr:prepilin-type N-terminal cleavage/methylation domain-containing protein [Patescibacteria group bacterium]
MKYIIKRFVTVFTNVSMRRSEVKWSLNRNSFFLKTGFTLIELLVVIAIIGILAAVVLASLNSARDKGKVTAIKSTLKNLQSQAEIYYSDNGTYAGLCNLSNSTIHASIQSFIDSLKSTAGPTNVKCFVYTSEAPYYYSADAMQTRNFAVAVAYANKHYAVDNTSVVTFNTSDVAGSYSWSGAQTACANIGKRLPSIEQFKAIWNIYGTSSPAGFNGYEYWSSSLFPSGPTEAYIFDFSSGYIDRYSVASGFSARCVS